MAGLVTISARPTNFAIKIFGDLEESMIWHFYPSAQQMSLGILSSRAMSVLTSVGLSVQLASVNFKENGLSNQINCLCVYWG
jgi:hypothetical protein